MERQSIHGHRLRRVEEAFASLPERYLGGEEGRRATVQIRLSDIGRTWEVELRPDRCKVRTSPCREPDVAVSFEGLFRLPDDRPPLLRMHDVRVRGARISCLTAGHGPQRAILIHGLGGAKSSFHETVAALSPDYTVHAIDLPGFGSSSKPL